MGCGMDPAIRYLMSQILGVFEYINNDSAATNHPHNKSTPIMEVMIKYLPD